jgi:acetyltransferase-like isoleucine patch superfamily enzyme
VSISEPLEPFVRLAAAPLRRAAGFWKNLRHGTRVDYREVALEARFGRGVEVMARSRIDQFCDIGSYSYIGFGCHISRATIGPYASIANNVSIGPGEHGLSQISTSAHFAAHAFDELTAKPLTLEADVWIGVDSIIRRGIRVGTGAVIGANSFVAHDVPAFAVVAGSPARLIRYRFTESQRARILESKWWESDPADAKRIIQQLQKVLYAEEGGPAR